MYSNCRDLNPKKMSSVYRESIKDRVSIYLFWYPYCIMLVLISTFFLKLYCIEVYSISTVGCLL